MSKQKTLKELRALAKELGIKIVAQRDDVGWGYWLEGTGWEDGNFCTDRDEVYSGLMDYRSQLFNEGKISIDGWQALIP